MTDAGTIDLDWHAMGADMTDGHATDADLADADVTDTNAMDLDADAMGSDDDMTDAGLTDGNMMDTRVMELGTGMIGLGSDTGTMDLDTGVMDSDTGAMDLDTGVMDSDTDATDSDASVIDLDTDTVEADMMDADADADVTASAIIINQFPFGHPGAPIVGPHQASAPNRSSSTDSEWSPFCSQIDWEVARWAKTCGIMSLAVRELLAIPGVSPPLIRLDVGLMHRLRLLMHLNFYTELQNN
jgi:hypothetical protein